MTEREEIIHEIWTKYETVAGNDYSRTSAALLAVGSALVSVTLDIRDCLASIADRMPPR